MQSQFPGVSGKCFREIHGKKTCLAARQSTWSPSNQGVTPHIPPPLNSGSFFRRPSDPTLHRFHPQQVAAVFSNWKISEVTNQLQNERNPAQPVIWCFLGLPSIRFLYQIWKFMFFLQHLPVFVLNEFIGRYKRLLQTTYTKPQCCNF